MYDSLCDVFIKASKIIISYELFLLYILYLVSDIILKTSEDVRFTILVKSNQLKSDGIYEQEVL